MTTFEQPKVSPAVTAAIRSAFRSIAPTWPLDRWIAVNPFWNLREQDSLEVSLDLATATGARMTMPRSYYRQLWRDGRLQRRHLDAAAAMEPVEMLRAGSERLDGDDLEQTLVRDDATPTRLPLLSDFSDRRRPADEPMPWSSMVVDQISQHLADHFDRGQVRWQAEVQQPYESWRTRVAADLSLPVRTTRSAFAARVSALPADPFAVVAVLAERIGLENGALEDYLVALLGSVRGWASWAAFESWQADLDGRAFEPAQEPLVQVLAIRAAWELLLLDEHDLQGALPELRMTLAALPAVRADLHLQQRRDWMLQHATELAFQDELSAGLQRTADNRQSTPSKTTPTLQAVFCIDVRSERFRRHLEQIGGEAVTTHGFAGFFGLPIAHRELDSDAAATPRLPGLLAPVIETHERTRSGEPLAERRRGRLVERARWGGFRADPTSAFTYVESLGVSYLPTLLRKSLRGDQPSRQDGKGLSKHERQSVQPSWPAEGPGSGAAERVELAAGVLKAMGLVRDFARVVLLVGHGSSSANNAHAAGLECGACGGHSGETNARLLASLLNEPAVRVGLRLHGIDVPQKTWFVAGLHDTTTDEVALYDTGDVPHAAGTRIEVVDSWLVAAGRRTRAERAPSLGLQDLQGDHDKLLRAVQRRSRDWAQTRPEWGLADNAAIVVGPRSLTRGLDLGGRAFLHDYDWRGDQGRQLLTQLLTAPVVVANWINLQYYASTVEPDQYGSGNKLLHNVVGGDLGVFEGNRGDLRIGLPRQSVHDGERLQHTPRRLTVVVAAPREAIDQVLAENEAPRSLADRRWLHLMRVDDEGRLEQRLPGGEWRALSDYLPPLPAEPEVASAAPPDASKNGWMQRGGDPTVVQMVWAFLFVSLGVVLRNMHA